VTLELAFDTETTGLFHNKLPLDHPSQPHLVQLAAILRDADTKAVVASLNLIVKPEGWTIPNGASNIHGITTEYADAHGVPRVIVLALFSNLLRMADRIIGHNVQFDNNVMRVQFIRVGKDYVLKGKEIFCTMLNSVQIVKVLHKQPRHDKDYKWPKLEECIRHLFDESLDGAHDAMVDILATLRVYDWLMEERDGNGSN